jgi:hypothetical protein
MSALLSYREIEVLELSETVELKTSAGMFVGLFDVTYTVEQDYVDGDPVYAYGDYVWVNEFHHGGTPARVLNRAFSGQRSKDGTLDAAIENALADELEKLWPKVEQFAHEQMGGDQ